MFRELLQVGHTGVDFRKPENSFSVMFLNLLAQYFYGIMDFTFSFSSPLGICVLSLNAQALVLIFREDWQLATKFFSSIRSHQTFPKDLASKLETLISKFKKIFNLMVFILCLGNLLSSPWKHNHGQPYELVLIYSFKYTYTILHAWYHSKHAEFLQAVFFLWFASSKSALLPITSASRNLIYTFL